MIGRGFAHWIARLVCRQTGAAAIEYGLVLALVAGTAAFVFVLLGLRVERSFADAGRLLRRIAIDRPPIQLAERNRQGDAFSAGQDVKKASSSEERFVWFALAVVAGLISGYGGWCWLRRKRRRQATPAPEDSPRPDTLPATLQEQLLAKRQQILKVLSGEIAVFLESRIEVRHLMTHEITKVTPKTPVSELVALMAEKRSRHALVCEQDRLLGIVSQGDLRSRSGNMAKEIMTADPVVVAPETPVVPAVTLLVNKGFSSLPVVEDGRPCGVLTTSDLMMTLQCTLRLLEQVAQHLLADPHSPSRVPVSRRSGLQVRVVTDNQRAWTPQALDLSMSGMQVEFPSADDPELPIGAQLGIELRLNGDFVSLAGTVRHRRGSCYGVFFLANGSGQHPAPPQPLRDILKRLEIQRLQQKVG